MSIRGKLGWNFFSLLLITAIIAFFGIYFIVRINNENSYVQNFPSFRYNILNHVSTEIMDTRRMVVMMTLNASNEAELNYIYNEFNELRAKIRSLLDAYVQSFQDFIVGVNRENSYAKKFSLNRYNILNQMSIEIMDMRYMVVTMAHHAGDEAELNRVYNEFMALRAGIRYLLDSYAQNLQDDRYIYGENREDAIIFAFELERRIARYIVEVVEPMFYIAMNEPNNQAEISQLLELCVEIYASIDSLLSGLLLVALETIENY
ncbi:MAG: MCP four helix bundle domain-containing protein [Defluviitaleaceae bacterium]|nr:MCP four helix bundle domain-containing protein [Defluviitaleaceae bacterium]